MLAAHRRKIHRGIVLTAFRTVSPCEPLKIPGPYSEADVIQYFEERAAENSNGYTSFSAPEFTIICAPW